MAAPPAKRRLGPLTRAALWCFALVWLVFVHRYSGLAADLVRHDVALVRQGEVVYVPDDQIVRVLTLGYNQAAADLLWLRTVDYFAQNFRGKRTYRWLNYFLEQILRFDPKFGAVYHWAGANVLYGSFFKREDVLASNHFYALALERFPDDYEAAYRLALNYMVELRTDDPEEKRRFQEIGLGYLELAAQQPKAPPQMRNLAASFSRQLGHTQLAQQYLLDQYMHAEDELTRASLLDRLHSLDAESAAQSAQEAERFHTHWQANFAYVPATLYALMGEPALGPDAQGAPTVVTPDRSWRDLLDILDPSDAPPLAR